MARTLRVFTLLALLTGTALLLPPAATTAHAQDTLGISDSAPHDPRGALWRAAVLPGWGQVYNRQYYKLPFVLGGLGGLVASALYNNDRYLTYRRAYLYALFPDQYPQYADEAAPFAPWIDANQEDLLRQQRNAFRRNRDLSYIGIGLFYGLTILDAYVNAHLLDFDVDEELSVRLLPGPHGVRLYATWRP